MKSDTGWGEVLSQSEFITFGMGEEAHDITLTDLITNSYCECKKPLDDSQETNESQ